LTLILAVATSGIVGWELIDGSARSHSFADFVRRIDFSSHTHALIDNVSFHHTKHVMKAFADMNVTPLYLPPYTPQWQPIEYVFSTVKKSFRATALDSIPLEDRVMGCISSKMCDIDITYRGIFSHCWRLARRNVLHIEDCRT